MHPSLREVLGNSLHEGPGEAQVGLEGGAVVEVDGGEAGLHRLLQVAQAEVAGRHVAA